MAELSTIARPYAEALIEALQDRKAGAEEMARVLEAVDLLARVAQDSQVLELAGDPKVTDKQVFDVIEGVLAGDVPAEVKNLLQTVVQNDRLEAVPEIARQFRNLKNASEALPTPSSRRLSRSVTQRLANWWRRLRRNSQV